MTDTNNCLSCSEFSKDCYNKSLIEECIHQAMRIPDEEASISRMTEFFNNFLHSNRLKTESWNRKAYLRSDAYTKMMNQLDIPELDMVNNIGVESKQYTVDLRNELIELRRMLEKCSEILIYDIDNSYKFLVSFFRLSAKAVFNPDNSNLNNLVFRKSKTLENLYGLGKLPFLRGDSTTQKYEGYSYFSICNPFALDSLRRVIYNTSVNRGRFSRVPVLRPIRVSILEDQALRAFTRFTSYSDFSSYKVELNRHNSEIISVPYHKLSSIEAVKPLRLFEKTVTYIHKRLEESMFDPIDKELTIKVLLIGHTEESRSKEEAEAHDDREICDWIHSVLAWYNRSFDQKEYPFLNLQITHLLSEGDFCSFLEKRNYQRNNLTGHLASHRFSVDIGSIDYQSEFYFSTSKLERRCRDNDLIFIIDCPWLTVESYDLKKDVSLGMYSRRIKRLNTISSDKADFLDSQQQTTMQELDTQYNRITSSDSSMHGDISRVFRDKIFKDIMSFISGCDSDIRKELYVFTSEKDGVDYSFLGSYPLTRTELYGGKCFTISMFSNMTPTCLEAEKKPEPFIIKLWAVLKYISISFAITEFKNSLATIIDKYIQCPEQYFELMRDIFIVVEPSQSMKELTISLRFSDRIEILFREMGIDKENGDAIKKKLYDLAYRFIYALYTEAVFSEHDDFGDKYIKTGFEMNLTSNARNVNDMLFIHEYRKAVSNNTTDRYKLNWKEEFNPAYYKDKNYTHEFFKDKELYSILLNNLEFKDHLSIGTLAMLNHSNRIYHTPAMAYRLMKNIINAYQTAEMDDLTIVQNTRHAIEQLK